MKIDEIQELEQTALSIRKKILKLSTNGGCFTGASLSCVDIIVYLYKKYLNIELGNLNSEERDYFFLSKGHDVPALYGMFTECGFLDEKRLLDNHLSTSDYIYWHPNRNINGVEFHSGSLGHLLSVAAGVAYDIKLKGSSNKVVVLLGDGELNEGSIWEGLLTVSAKRLGNMRIIVDRNYFQANMKTEDLIPIEPLEKKFEAFGLNTIRCNGHNFEDLEDALKASDNFDMATVIIAETVRGKGVSSIEERADRWFCNFTQEEVEELIVELESGKKAEIKSETLIVR